MATNRIHLRTLWCPVRPEMEHYTRALGRKLIVVSVRVHYYSLHEDVQVSNRGIHLFFRVSPIVEAVNSSIFAIRHAVH